MTISDEERTDEDGGPAGRLSETSAPCSGKPEETIHALHQRMRLLEETEGVGIWDWYIQTNEMEWSDNYRRIFGLENAGPKPSRQASLNVVHPSDRARVRRALDLTAELGSDWDEKFRIVLPDGQIRWVHARGKVLRDAQGQAVRMFGTARDVSDREAHDKLAREREAHLHSILETVPDAMVVIDERGIVESFSKAAEKLFGYPASEVEGRNVSMLMPSPDREAHNGYIARYLETGQARIIGIGRVVFGRRKDGSEFPMELQIGEVHNGDRRIFTGFIHDLTERQRTEKRMQDLQSELIHVSRLSAMGTMATTLAHELNQPLTAIANYVEAARELLSGTNDDPETPAFIAEAMESAAAQSVRAGKIVRRLRDFVSRGEVDKSIEYLPRLIEEATALALTGQGGTGLQVRRWVDPDAAYVLVDRIQIQQVLLNLLRNAAEAMEHTPVRQIFISVSRRDEDWVRVTVGDSGPGIPAEIAANLFAPFTSTKEYGMGVGLSICHTIIEAHGGKIWCEPNPDGGTLFHFTLMRGAES